MRILAVTGQFAKEDVRRFSKDYDVDVIDLPVTVAAFLTPKKIASYLKQKDVTRYDFLLTPGLVRGDVGYIERELGIPTYKGPRTAADLPVLLSLIERFKKVKLSKTVPACVFIKEKLEKEIKKEIDRYREDRELINNLLGREGNFLIKDLPLGKDFPMRVLAEVVNAPILKKRELIAKVEYYISNGADMIDLGMIAGEDYAKKAGKLVKIVKDNFDCPVSIDSMNPEEIWSGVNKGADLVLSGDKSNLDDLSGIDVPVVIVPTDYSREYVPHKFEERIKLLKENIDIALRNKIFPIADPLLDPIHSTSLSESIATCVLFRREFKNIPLFFGLGNVTELLDADSPGATAVLAGIASELDACILFAPEASDKTRKNIRELSIASKMMFISKIRRSPPKDIGIDLLTIKEKRKKGETLDIDVTKVEAKEKKGYRLDPAGIFRIIVDNRIRAIHFLNGKPTLEIVGENAKEICDEIMRRNLVSMLDHAFYLGRELCKAEIALKLDKSYIQDLPLF
ncbi:MAG: dihydropteroate synthase-like protein [Candidatus Hydrothermarchaeota archaeon]